MTHNHLLDAARRYRELRNEFDQFRASGTIDAENVTALLDALDDARTTLVAEALAYEALAKKDEEASHVD